MNRSQKDTLATKLREIIERLRKAPEEAKARGVADRGDRSSDSPYPYAFGALGAMVEHETAQLDALVHVHLDHGRGRR